MNHCVITRSMNKIIKPQQIKTLFFLVSLSLSLNILVSCGDKTTEKKAQEKTEFKIRKKTEERPKTKIVPATIPQSENKLGRRVFLLCAACHNVVKGEAHKVGPNLNGFFGKKAGTKKGFVYSDALKDKGITWSEETLRAWLENPASYVPGTKMAFVGVKKKEQQDALIAYLKEVTKE